MVLLVGTGYIGWVIYRNGRTYFRYKRNLKKYQTTHHLMDSDLEMYQRIMDELKKQIIYLNELTNKSRNLKKIEQVELGVASAKGIFKHLVKYPEAITHFSDFLYHKVPEILRASERFLSIKEDKLSTEEITLATNGILSTIRVLSESITDDYEKLVSEASEEIALSKKLVERKNG